MIDRSGRLKWILLWRYQQVATVDGVPILRLRQNA